ncbi:MAG: ABC transporter permease [Alphaproteobacteria bacterium]
MTDVTHRDVPAATGSWAVRPAAGWLRRQVGPRLLVGLIVPAIALVGWELLAAADLISTKILPPPSAVLGTIGGLAADGSLWGHVWITLWRVALGFLFGVAAGTVLGAVTGYSTTLYRLLDPTIQGLRSIPSIAWVPLFILWFGIFEVPKVTLIAVGVFFPVYLGLATAVHGVDRKLVEVARIYRYAPLQLIGRVLLPASLPAYVTALRNGLGLGWMFVVAAEFMGASQGLGYLLIDGQQTGRAAMILAAILLFAVIGKLTDSLLHSATKPLLRWQDSFKKG